MPNPSGDLKRITLTHDAVCSHCGHEWYEGESVLVEPQTDGSQLVYCDEDCAADEPGY